MLKKIMIPVAAFAVTVTTASAFNPDMLEKINVDLSDSQVSALETAHEMKDDGADREDVKAYLEANGVDEGTMKEIKEAAREVHDAEREAVKTALDNDDYEAFLTAIANSPLADAIDSEADFEKFKAANELRDSGDHKGAKELMDELGIEKPEGPGGKIGGDHDGRAQGGQRAEK